MSIMTPLTTSNPCPLTYNPTDISVAPPKVVHSEVSRGVAMSTQEHAGAGEKRRGLGGVVVWVAGGVGCRWRLAWRRVQRAVDIVNKKKQCAHLKVP